MASTVAKLYVALGVDADELKVGFEKADQTVGQYISKLNREAKMIKLQAQLDLGNLPEGASRLDQLKVKVKELQTLMANTQMKVNISQQSVNAYTSKFGANNAKTQQEQLTLMYRQSDLQKLQRQLKEVNAEINQINGNGIKLSGAQKAVRQAKQLKSGLDKCTKTLMNLSNALNVMSSMGSSLGGLTDFVSGAMSKGENLYQMMNKLHESAADTGALMKMATMSGTDGNQIFGFLARLDNTMKSYDEESESVKKKMEAYGIQLKNDNGTLKSTTEQLKELADAYKRANAQGLGKDFQVNILGKFGQGLESLLANFDEVQAKAKSITGAGLLDPKQAHEAYMDMQALNAQAGQMKDVLATAMMPVVKELMPEMTKLLGEAAGFIKDNKDAIKGFGELGVTAIGGIVSAAEGLVKALGEVNNALPTLGATNDELQQLQAHYGKDTVSMAKGGAAALGAVAAGGVAVASGGGSIIAPAAATAGAASGNTLAEAILEKLAGQDIEFNKAEMDTFQQAVNKFNESVSWFGEKYSSAASQDFRQVEYGSDDELAAVAEKYNMTLDEFKTAMMENMAKMGMSIDQMTAAGEKWNISGDDIKDYVMQQRVNAAALSDQQYQILNEQQMSAAQYVGILDYISSSNVRTQAQVEQILREFNLTPAQFKELIDNMWSESKEVNDKAKAVWAKMDGFADKANKAVETLNQKLQAQIDQLTLSGAELATKQANQQKEQNIKNGADPELANKLASLQIGKALKAEEEKRVSEAKSFGTKLKSAHDQELSARDKIKSAAESLASAVEGAQSAHKRVKDLQQELYQLQTYGKILSKDPIQAKKEEIAQAIKDAQKADQRVQEAKEQLASAKSFYNQTNVNFQRLLQSMDNNTRAILGQELDLSEITAPVEMPKNANTDTQRSAQLMDAMKNGVEVWRGTQQTYDNERGQSFAVPQGFDLTQVSGIVSKGMSEALANSNIGEQFVQAQQAYAQNKGYQPQQNISVDATTNVDMSGSVNSNDVIDKAKAEATAVMKEKTQQLTSVIQQANNSLNYSF